MRPAFAQTPGIGTLDWGLTAAPITYDPPLAGPDEVRNADPASLRIPALEGIPVAVVSSETSVQATFAPDMVRFLVTAGAAAEHLHLPDHGVLGNGHGLIYETNSDEALQPVLQWLTAHTPPPADARCNAQDDVNGGDGATLLVTYSGGAGARFDRDYYVGHHLPLVTAAWSAYGLLEASALFPADDTGPTAVCICRFADPEAFDAALAAPRTPEVMADLVNFTDVSPTQSRVRAQ